MQERQVRTAVVLVSLLAVLLLINALWEPPEDDLDAEASVPVWTIARDDIVHVEARHADGELVLALRDHHWFVEAPFRDHAVARQVGYLLDELERVKKGVPIPDADPDEFGLGDPPTVTITATLADGTKQTLQVGDQTPVGWRTYVRAADGSVVAVAGIVGDRFKMDPEKLRDHSVVHFEPETVRRVEIRGRENVLAVSGEGSRWWVEGWTRADPDRIDDLIMGLRDLHFDTLIGYDPAVEGIEAPVYTVGLETTEGALHFEVGGLGPEGVLVRAGSGRAGWVDPERLGLLGQGPRDVGDLRAFPLDPSADEAVEVRLGDAQWSARYHEGRWRSDSRDDAAVKAAIDAVTEAPIHYRLAPVPGFTEVWGRVEVRRGEASPRVVEVGPILEDGLRVARDADGGAPYLVPADALEDPRLRL